MWIGIVTCQKTITTISQMSCDSFLSLSRCESARWGPGGSGSAPPGSMCPIYGNSDNLVYESPITWLPDCQFLKSGDVPLQLAGDHSSGAISVFFAPTCELRVNVVPIALRHAQLLRVLCRMQITSIAQF